MALSRLGRPKTGDVDPQAELLGMVAEAAGNVVSIREWMQESGDDAYGPIMLPDGSESGRAEEHVLARMYREWCDRLVQYSAVAIKAGIGEREVRLKEQLGAVVMRAMLTLLDHPDLGLSREQRETGRRVAGPILRVLGQSEEAAG